MTTVALAALALSACGGDDETPTTQVDTPTTQAQTPTTTTADETTEDATDDDTATGMTGDDDDTTTGMTGDDDDTTTGMTGDDDDTTTGMAGDDDTWMTVVRTAETEAGGTAYELDDPDADGTWEVDVAVGDRSVEVTVSADGAQVEQTEDDDLDDDDRQALDAASISLTDAITTALAEVDGTLDDAELDEEDGSLAWEVSVDQQQGDDVEVYVDVTTGDVLRVD